MKKILVVMLLPLIVAAKNSKEEECLKPKSVEKPRSRSQVYADVPFKPGEKAVYEVFYLGALVGYGTLSVRSPIKLKGVYQRSFHAEAQTGDWYSAIFVAKDKIQAIVRPDYAVTKVYTKQDEGALFGSRFIQDKWLDYDHDNCEVSVRVKKVGKPEKNEKYFLQYGAQDALSAAYRLRTFAYKLGVVEKFLVYTSEKNWWLEAKPIAIETIKVPGGTFEAHKLKLQTYLGQDLQQKGDVYVWIATSKHPGRPMVKVSGEIKIGSVDIILKSFKGGR